MLFEAGQFTNSYRSSLFPDKLYFLDQAAKLLPDEVIDNLTKGIPIWSNTSVNRLAPYSYSPDFISAVAGICLQGNTLYPSELFKKNIEAYITVFGLPDKLYIFSSGPIPTEHTPLKKRGTTSTRVFQDGNQLPPKRKKRVFFHGRSNGFPTPLGIRTFQLAKKVYPDHEIWFGVDSDQSSLEKGQKPFMDPQFRGSCYLYTNLVDKVILLEPPAEHVARKEYWQLMYSRRGNLSPDIIVIPNNDLTERKKGDSDGATVITYDEIFGDNFSTFDQLHQTDLKKGSVSLRELVEAWRIIAEDLFS